MRARRDEVREEADPLTAALNQYRLVIGHVSGRRKAAEAGKGLRLAVDERERDRLEVGREVARRRALVGVARELQLPPRSEEHTSELQSQSNLVCRLLLEKKKKTE